MGEMERDALISSGGSYTLWDRFMGVSDGYILPLKATGPFTNPAVCGPS